MSKATSIILGDRTETFVKRQIAEGKYQSETEIVEAGLRLLEERETKLEALREALIEGEESGFVEDFDFDEFIARKHAEPASK
jgi:antitoxin ParD1/3/4